jgi:hypothetical protein
MGLFSLYPRVYKYITLIQIKGTSIGHFTLIGCNIEKKRKQKEAFDIALLSLTGEGAQRRLATASLPEEDRWRFRWFGSRSSPSEEKSAPRSGQVNRAGFPFRTFSLALGSPPHRAGRDWKEGSG